MTEGNVVLLKIVQTSEVLHDSTFLENFYRNISEFKKVLPHPLFKTFSNPFFPNFLSCDLFTLSDCDKESSFNVCDVGFALVIALYEH